MSCDGSGRKPKRTSALGAIMLALIPPSTLPMLKRSPVSPPKRACASASTRSSALPPQRIAWCNAFAVIALAPEACPASPRNFISTELIPRCASTASQRVGSAMIASLKPWSLPRNAAMQRGSLASSSEENRKAASPSVTFAAAIRPAAAPLMSHTPRPTTRSSKRRITCGSAVQASDDGTVSRCTLNTRRGLPRTANKETAPSPWSATSMRNPGSCARM